MASSSLQVAGLASGFDWKSFIDQIMEVERAPQQRLAAEQAANSEKAALLGTLGGKLSALQDAANALSTSGVFRRQSVQTATSGSRWSLAAGSDTPAGVYRIAVSRLATTASLAGAGQIARPLAASGAAAGALSLATLPLAQPITAGTFSVNGQKVTVAATGTLQDVFDAIATATGGAVTAGYDAGADKITLHSTGALTLGAANDTSNFLAAAGLGNGAVVAQGDGSADVASANRLGALKRTAALASANLAAPIDADADGNGAFTLNGTSITYNVNTDTLATLLQRISDSAAGVTASYDGRNGRIVLANRVTGDLAITACDDAGGLLGALGLTAGTTFTRGRNAQFTVNEGDVIESTSNTLTEAAHGITGLSVTVDTEETQAITVAADTASRREKLDAFIAKFNDVQQYIDANTRIATDARGKVTAAKLASNREVHDWGRSLRSLVFSAVDGQPEALNQLEDMGLDFRSGTSELAVASEAKLAAALANSTANVATFFEQATTGFAARLDTFLTRIDQQKDDQQERLNKANTSLAEQVTAIERRLQQQRELMESAFLQMERAQSTIKRQQSAIDSIVAANKS